jgi:hypothetical protein
MKLFIVCYLLTNVLGYGYKMHKYLGGLTDVYLQEYEPNLYNKVTKILGGNSISSISSWADKVKRQGKYAWTKDLHFIDILECHRERYSKDIIDKYCKNHCIVSAIQDFTNSIKFNWKYDYKTNSGITLTNNELLKFLIHFIQDLSQPMHLLGYERGGNSFPVTVLINNKNVTSNLHYIWDSMLPEYFIKTYSYNNSYNTNYSKPHDYSKLLEDVLNDNMWISCRIYPDSHYIVFKEYFKKDYFIKLFDNYRLLMISTLKYILEDINI